MNETFITLLLFGSLKDPILWILSFTIGSGLLVKKNNNIYLLIAGIIWGFIRLYVYKALGESLNDIQALLLIISCLILMLIIGNCFRLLIKLIKTII